MRTFLEWQKQEQLPKAIFIDQDDTILKTTFSPQKGREIHTIKFNGNNILISVAVRPNASQFLEACRNIASTYILTAGNTDFQKKVLERVGLIKHLDGVFGADMFHNLPKTRGILIDNLPHNSSNSQGKLAAMGGGLYLQVPEWTGDQSNDNILLEILPKIKQSLANAVF